MSRARATMFSVVICTHDRAGVVEAAIQSVFAQDYPREAIELVVVDNASRDGTRALVERDAASAPIPVSYVLEPRLGTALARNRGAQHAANPYVAYLDDDTVARRDWLAAYDRAIREHGLAAGGGPVDPVLEPGVVAPVWWGARDVQAIFGLDHAGRVPDERVVAIRWPLWLGAGNSVYSNDVLREHGGFRADHGPQGRTYRIAEDVDLNVRLERAGVPIHYVRDARIQHRITADRLARRYLWRRAYAAGLTDAAARALLGGAAGPGSLSRLTRAALRVLVSGEPERTVAGCRVAYHAARLRASLALSRA